MAKTLLAFNPEQRSGKDEKGYGRKREVCEEGRLIILQGQKCPFSQCPWPCIAKFQGGCPVDFSCGIYKG